MFQTSVWIALGVSVAVGAILRRIRAPMETPVAGGSRAWDRFLLVVLGLPFLVLLITGFRASLFTEARLTGFPLLLHCAAGLGFAVALAAAAFAWAEDCRFGRRVPGRAGASPRFDPVDKALFWLVCVSALASLLAVLVSMAAVFGPPGLRDLYEVHRYGSLLVVCLILIYTYRTVIWKSRARRSVSAGDAGIAPEGEGEE